MSGFIVDAFEYSNAKQKNTLTAEGILQRLNPGFQPAHADTGKSDGRISAAYCLLSLS